MTLVLCSRQSGRHPQCRSRRAISGHSSCPGTQIYRAKMLKRWVSYFEEGRTGLVVHCECRYYDWQCSTSLDCATTRVADAWDCVTSHAIYKVLVRLEVQRRQVFDEHFKGSACLQACHRCINTEMKFFPMKHILRYSKWT